MNSDERADRRDRIKTVATASDNRVRDFIDLVAKMCAERTRARKVRVSEAQGYTPPEDHDAFGRPTEVHQRHRYAS